MKRSTERWSRAPNTDDSALEEPWIRAHKIGLRHILYVAIPPRSTRARAWALQRGIGEPDAVNLSKMLRLERLNCG
jgi:hypothetical protein